MPIGDKVDAAKKIDGLLKGMLASGGFRLHYKIEVDPSVADDRDWERPDIQVTLSGPDSPLLLERGADLLRSMEHIALKMLRLESDEHDRVSFDCMNYKAVRLAELKLAAGVAAERVLKSGVPYKFSPMSARERRIVHLALRDHPELQTASEGEGGQRYVVVSPKNYKARPAR